MLFLQLTGETIRVSWLNFDLTLYKRNKSWPTFKELQHFTVRFLTWVLNVWQSNQRLVSVNCKLHSHLKAISRAVFKSSSPSFKMWDFNSMCKLNPDARAETSPVQRVRTRCWSWLWKRENSLNVYMAELGVSMCERARLYVLPVRKTSKSTGAANDRPMHVWIPQLAHTANYPPKKYPQHRHTTQQQMHAKLILSQKRLKIRSTGYNTFGICATVWIFILVVTLRRTSMWSCLGFQWREEHP